MHLCITVLFLNFVCFFLDINLFQNGGYDKYSILSMQKRPILISLLRVLKFF